MRRTLALVAALVAAATLSAQTNPNIARRIVTVSALPATCTSGTSWKDIVYLRTGTVGAYVCTATNTWTIVGGGGGGGVSFPLLATDGTAAAPSYSFTNSAGTGMYLSSANVLGFATGGTAKWLMDASGGLGRATANSTAVITAHQFATDINGDGISTAAIRGASSAALYFPASPNQYGFYNANTDSVTLFDTSAATGTRTISYPDATGTLGLKVGVPASAGAAGKVGTWAADGSFFYVCTAANTWLRVAIATW